MKNLSIHIPYFIILSFLLLSCGTFRQELDTDNYAHHALVLGDDKSESNQVNPRSNDELLSILSSKVDFGDGAAIDFYVVDVLNPLPSWDSVRLLGRNMLISPEDERQSDEEHFLIRSETIARDLFTRPSTGRVSHIYQGLCYSIALLDSLAEKRTLIFRSDFIEDSRIKFKQIDLSRKNYAAIRDQFTEIQPLPNGIDQSLDVMLLATDQSQKGYEALKFFEWLLADAGAHVSVRSL